MKLLLSPAAARELAWSRLDSWESTPSMICAGTRPPPLSAVDGNRPCGVYDGRSLPFQPLRRRTSSLPCTARSVAHSACAVEGWSDWSFGSLRVTAQARAGSVVEVDGSSSPGVMLLVWMPSVRAGDCSSP